MSVSRLTCCLILLSVPAIGWAETISNAGKGYSFTVPANWRMAHPDFTLTGPTGASLTESSLHPAGTRSLEHISKTAGMIACIGADYQDTLERFELGGENWKGLVSVFKEPMRGNRHPRHVLQLVAQHGENFRLFYLAVPSQEWLGDRNAARALLAALRFD
ncbi:hypothetical protein [Panacagrimonas sp.]|uniref:hypothetical protein n=1 Tax=Panacagrimonas sp. TaxID=2480088 RepID=UPI003B517A73